MIDKKRNGAIYEVAELWSRTIFRSLFLIMSFIFQEKSCFFNSSKVIGYFDVLKRPILKFIFRIYFACKIFLENNFLKNNQSSLFFLF